MFPKSGGSDQKILLLVEASGASPVLEVTLTVTAPEHRLS